MSDLPRPVEQGRPIIEKPAVPRPAEPQKEIKPLGVAEQQIISRIDKDGDEDKVLRDIAGTPQAAGEAAKSPFQQFLDDEAARKTPIVGGEIVTPTAVRVDDPKNADGSVNFRASQERGWLSAISSASGKRELPEAERQKNIQEIVNAAMAAGVSREQVGKHLQSIGINAVRREDLLQPQAANSEQKGTEAQPQTEEASLNRSLDYVNRLAESVLGGKTEPSALQNYVDYIVRNGVPRDRIEAILQARGINFHRRQEAQVRNQASQTQEAAVQSNGLKEQLKNADNSFNDENASRILAVTRDWVKYGGNFYDHLTGKDPHLERGVDYGVLPDGRIDMEAYKAARHKKVEAWLQEPGNRKWLAEGNQFLQDHQGNVSYGMETVKVRQPDGTLVDKQRYTNPYLYDNGWLYYESNYFDKQTGEMTQPDRESTKYRVYFSPDGENVMGTFQDVITQLNADSELQKLGFQIKTADVAKLNEPEVSKIMNQRDRVVLYLGEEGMAKALPILQKYAESHPGMFNQEGVLLGQPLVDSQGNKIPGIVTTAEPRGKSPDPASSGEYKSFNEVQGKIIGSSYRTILTAIKEPQVLAQLKAKYPGIHQGISTLGDKAATVDYLRVIIADPNGEDFLKRNLQAVYPQWAKAYGMSVQNIAFAA